MKNIDDLLKFFANTHAKYGNITDDLIQYSDDVSHLVSNYGDDVSDSLLKANARDLFTDNTKDRIIPQTTEWLGGVVEANPQWFHPDIPQTYGYRDMPFVPQAPYSGINNVLRSKVNPIPSVRVPNLNTKDLVLDSFTIDDFRKGHYGEPIGNGTIRVDSLRPHKNTALGRWFREQLTKNR